MKNNFESEFEAVHVDMSHKDVLSTRIQRYANKEAEEFIQRVRQFADTAYLHLDVQPQKEQTRNTPSYRWRALLVTNRGRYYADDWSFGAIESLKQVLDKVEQQLHQRLSKLSEHAREVSA